MKRKAGAFYGLVCVFRSLSLSLSHSPVSLFSAPCVAVNINWLTWLTFTSTTFNLIDASACVFLQWPMHRARISQQNHHHHDSKLSVYNRRQTPTKLGYRLFQRCQQQQRPHSAGDAVDLFIFSFCFWANYSRLPFYSIGFYLQALICERSIMVIFYHYFASQTKGLIDASKANMDKMANYCKWMKKKVDEKILKNLRIIERRNKKKLELMFYDF